MDSNTLHIAEFNSHAANTTDRNPEVTFAQCCAELAQPVVTGPPMAEFAALPRHKRSAIKNRSGCYLLGQLRRAGGQYHRCADGVISRGALAIDYEPAGDVITALLTVAAHLPDTAYAIHPTHSHRPDQTRLRLIVPLSRPAMPDEWVFLTHYLVRLLGTDDVDGCSDRIAQLMYWPSCAPDAVEQYHQATVTHPNRAPFAVDALLEECPDWRDFICITANRGATRDATTGRSAALRDPRHKPGIIGRFCRAYSCRDILRDYLADIWEPVPEWPGRYTRSESSGVAGGWLIDDHHFISFHGTDPHAKRVLNAFDLYGCYS